MDYEELYLRLYDSAIRAFEKVLPPAEEGSFQERYLRLQSALTEMIGLLQAASDQAREQEAAVR